MSSLKKVPRAALAGAGAVVALILVGAVLAGCGSSSSEDVKFNGSGYPGVDVANTRQAKGSIDSSTVASLEEAWSLPLTAKSSFGSYASSPIVSNGVIYSQDLASNVKAISLDSGEVLWSKSYNAPDEGPNGLVVAGGRVYGATPSSAFALDQKTGKEIWSVELTRNEHEGIDMAPGYRDGMVYVSTVPLNVSANYEGGGAGILWALDAKTGKKIWHFDTVPTNLWKKPAINAGGGLWYAPSFDSQGSMYFGVGNPAPFPGTEKYPWGSSRPGPNLYTDSIVKLDAKTGKLRWYYQQTPHDIYDWDLQDPPILVNAGGRQLAITSGKVGVVVAVDRKSGKVVWKRSVGTHNGHDKDSIYAMNGEYSKLKTGATVYPGQIGGVIAPMSTDGKSVFVPVVNHSLTIGGQEEIQEEGALTGELVAIDIATGAVKWSHKFQSAAFGATTVVNDLVFATTFEGTVHAFDTSSGAEVWEATLPAGTNSGVVVSGDTLIAPAGIASAEGQKPAMVAYRLPGDE
ncbi:MAG TPA: PQQ-binding-like beta-propeller repeat protein [Solirubrobacterales bacterium]